MLQSCRTKGKIKKTVAMITRAKMMLMKGQTTKKGRTTKKGKIRQLSISLHRPRTAAKIKLRKNGGR